MSATPTGFEKCSNQELTEFILGNRADKDMPKAMQEVQRRGYNGKITFADSVAFYRALHDTDVDQFLGAFDKGVLFCSASHDWLGHLMVEGNVYHDDRKVGETVLHLHYMTQREDEQRLAKLRAFVVVKVMPKLRSRRRWLYENGNAMNENDIPKELKPQYLAQRDNFLRVCQHYNF